MRTDVRVLRTGTMDSSGPTDLENPTIASDVRDRSAAGCVRSLRSARAEHQPGTVRSTGAVLARSRSAQFYTIVSSWPGSHLHHRGALDGRRFPTMVGRRPPKPSKPTDRSASSASVPCGHLCFT